MAKHKVKITVLKTIDPSVVFDGNVPNNPSGRKYKKCNVFKPGQEFLVNKKVQIPEKFCSWAWNDIYKDISVLAWGGNFDPWVEKGIMISCCTDGIRPVVFKLERIAK
jgi:uncharacterized repeat protein (TIGR04076 family)